VRYATGMDVDLHVAAWRKHRGLTQAELAARVGIHRVALARIEAGAEPKAGTFLGLASALDTTCEGLLAEPGVLTHDKG
jgi:transcriptional regulator with XRE-family HTH domain